MLRELSMEGFIFRILFSLTLPTPFQETVSERVIIGTVYDEAILSNFVQFAIGLSVPVVCSWHNDYIRKDIVPNDKMFAKRTVASTEK